MTYIPILLIWEYLFLFLIRNTNWYAENQSTLDNIDTILVLVAIIHFLAQIEIYNKLKITYFFCLFLIIQLQLAYYYIPEDIYFLLYLLIILAPVLLAIKKWLTQN